jgi:hypothetical protein
MHVCAAGYAVTYVTTLKLESESYVTTDGQPAGWNLPRLSSLYSLGSDRIEGTISNSSFFVADVLASHSLATVRFFRLAVPADRTMCYVSIHR